MTGETERQLEQLVRQFDYRKVRDALTPLERLINSEATDVGSRRGEHMGASFYSPGVIHATANRKQGRNYRR